MTASPSSDTLLDRLGSLELLVITGKGGVGKSAVAAALGDLLRRPGRQVLLLEVAERETLYHYFDAAPSDGVMVDLQPDLLLQNLRPRHELDRLVGERLPIPLLVKRVLKSQVYKHFTEGAPGLKELAVLGHGYRQIRDGRAKQVILDAPATGHALSLLTAPRLVAEAIRGGPFGELARELAAFVDDRKRCGVVLVTLAEEMPVQETLELRAAMNERLGRQPELLIVNGLYPEVPAAVAAAAARGELDEAGALWVARRRNQDLRQRRLRSAWTGPTVELQLFPLERSAALRARLGEQLGRSLSVERGSGVAP